MSENRWETISEWLTQARCRILGHTWWEIPRALRGNREKHMYECRRCHLMSGATN